MKKLGGGKPNLMVRSVMKKLITDPVLDRYTWKGTIDKKCFENLTNINDVVYDAVSGVFKKYTLYKYGKYMVEFLKHSLSRQRELVKYRKKRGTKNDGVSNEEGDDNRNDDDDEILNYERYDENGEEEVDEEEDEENQEDEGNKEADEGNEVDEGNEEDEEDEDGDDEEV